MSSLGYAGSGSGLSCYIFPLVYGRVHTDDTEDIDIHSMIWDMLMMPSNTPCNSKLALLECARE